MTEEDNTRGRVIGILLNHRLRITTVEPGVWRPSCFCGTWQGERVQTRGRAVREHVKEHLAGLIVKVTQ